MGGNRFQDGHDRLNRLPFAVDNFRKAAASAAIEIDLRVGRGERVRVDVGGELFDRLLDAHPTVGDAAQQLGQKFEPRSL